MREIFYFLQWYFKKQITKISNITYRPALWHFTGPAFLISLYFVCNEITDTGSVDVLEFFDIMFFASFGITSVWYFVKLLFFWDWIDYQREKQQVFDALNSSDKED